MTIGPGNIDDPSDIFLTETDDGGGSGGEGVVTSDPPPNEKPPPAPEIATVNDLFDLNQIAGGAEVWRISDTGQVFLVWYIEGTDIPIAWEVTDDADLQAMFGTGQTIKYNDVMTYNDFLDAGVMTFGDVTELDNDADHPFEGWLRRIEDQKAVRPWLMDADILAIMAASILEPMDSETMQALFEQTDWWRGKSATERQWLLVNASDPATAAQMQTDAYLAVTNMLTSQGVTEISDELVMWLGDRMVSGLWTQAYTATQITKISDPYSPFALDGDLELFISGLDFDLDITQDQEAEVKATVARMLGPMFSSGWKDEEVARWAGAFRNDPDAEDKLNQLLRDQLAGLFPSRNLTDQDSYESLAAPWRGFYSNVWGQTADETDDLFLQLIALNDASKGRQLLNKAGLESGNRAVTSSFLKSLSQAFGSQVRPVL